MKSFVLAAVAAVLAGCASTDAPTTTTPTEQVSTTDRVYRPGSNILVKDRTPMTKEEKEKQADEARAILTTTPRPAVIR